MGATPRVVLAWVALLITGCDGGAPALEVQVEYSAPVSVRAGDPVRLGEAVVGRVGRVAGATLTLALDRAAAGRLREGAAALVRGPSSDRYVALYNPVGQSPPIASGARLTPLDSGLDYAAWTAAQALGDVVASVVGYFDTAQWRQAEARLREQLTRLRETSEAGLRELGARTEAWLQRLREAPAAALERNRADYDRLARELAERMAELEAQGRQGLAQALQALSRELAAVMEGAAPEQEPPPPAASQ